MDKKKLQLEAADNQAKHFESLASHPEWPYFYDWVKSARDKADRALKHKDTRRDHIALVEASAAYHAYNGILEGFDGAIKRGIEARVELTKRS